MQDIVFHRLAAPLRLRDARAVLPVLQSVAAGWPVEIRSQAGAEPFYSVTGQSDTPLLWCDCHLDDRPSRWFDPVNAVCDLVSVLALALPAERPDLICLHAAAVAMSGRLVVFPNIRKAGKSLLSAALARAGQDVFSDDVLPVFQDGTGLAHGLAMGIAPRLRLPLPEAVSQDFRDWVAAHAGPANAQYQYLSLAGQPVHGATLPVGAFVILDREDHPGPARLTPVAPDAAMDALLHQNFTRDRHSADILHAMAAMLTARPAYRITYSDLEEGVACLTAAFAGWPDAAPKAEEGPGQPFRMAAPEPDPGPSPPMHRPVRQRGGCAAVRIGERLYLSDPEGRAIHRTDPMAESIWTVLEDPVTGDELVDILAASFPKADRQEIASDLRALIGRFNSSGLITAG